MKKKDVAVCMRAEDVEARLREHFPANAYALLPQVNNGTGTAGGSAYADAIVFSLWPSRGLELMGVEIKVYRGDWLRELKEPGKAEHIAQYCNRWWVATSHGIVKDGELPPTWGLLEATLDGEKLKVKVKAPALNPAPLDLPFIASLFRAAAKQNERPIQQRGYNEGYSNGRSDGLFVKSKSIAAARAALRRALTQLEEETEGTHFWRYRDTIMQGGDGI